jgi:hypothetical protein
LAFGADDALMFGLWNIHSIQKASSADRAYSAGFSLVQIMVNKMRMPLQKPVFAK